MFLTRCQACFWGFYQQETDFSLKKVAIVKLYCLE